MYKTDNIDKFKSDQVKADLDLLEKEMKAVRERAAVLYTNTKSKKFKSLSDSIGFYEDLLKLRKSG